MISGFQVFDASANLIVDVTDKVLKVLGWFDTGTSNGSISVPKLAGRRAFFIKTIGTFNYRYALRTSTIQINSSGVISWTFAASGLSENVSSRIIYGYY